MLEEARRFYEIHHEIQPSRRRHRYYYDFLTRILPVRVPPGVGVLDVSCGSRDLLALEPSCGVGIDVAAAAIRSLCDPALLAQAGGPFDVILTLQGQHLARDWQPNLAASVDRSPSTPTAT